MWYVKKPVTQHFLPPEKWWSSHFCPRRGTYFQLDLLNVATSVWAVVCSYCFYDLFMFLPTIAGTQSRRDDAGRDLAGLAADFHAVKRGIIALYLERVCSQNVGASPVISGVCGWEQDCEQNTELLADLCCLVCDLHRNTRNAVWELKPLIWTGFIDHLLQSKPRCNLCRLGGENNVCSRIAEQRLLRWDDWTEIAAE